jgi:CheY-like chemotaxis protein
VKQRILVVEDNLANRELLRDWLEVEGYEVLIASAPTMVWCWHRGCVSSRCCA